MQYPEKQINAKYFRESPFQNRGFHNFDSTAQLPRHRWYYLKEGFSASLVHEAIGSKLAGKSRRLNILEPFCGTGTTPLTAALMGHFCTAIEVNPFLAFTARVKATPERWHEAQFLRVLSQLVETRSRGTASHLEGFSTFTRRDGLSKWLFNKSVIRGFSSLLASIDRFGRHFGDAMILAAVVAAYNCCNAKRDGKALRYKPNWKGTRYTDKDFVRQFRLNAIHMLQDILAHPIAPQYRPEIHTGDSRERLSTLEDGKFDLVVTSPPYLNSFDYSDIYRPELFLSGYVSDNDDLREIRLQTVRSHIQVKWPAEVSFESPLLNPVIDQLNASKSLWDKRLPLMVHAYFDDMWRVFRALKPKMQAGGQVWLVVSTSAYGGVHIPVDFILADAADQVGFSLKGIHCLRHLRAAGQQWRQFETTAPPLRESLIIMSNN